jgi:hypothetical protein
VNRNPGPGGNISYPTSGGVNILKYTHKVLISHATLWAGLFAYMNLQKGQPSEAAMATSVSSKD